MVGDGQRLAATALLDAAKASRRQIFALRRRLTAAADGDRRETIECVERASANHSHVRRHLRRHRPTVLVGTHRGTRPLPNVADHVLEAERRRAPWIATDRYRCPLTGGLCVGGTGRERVAPGIQMRGRLSLIHISEPTRLGMISYAVF